VHDRAYVVPVREIGPVAYASAVPVSRKRKKKPSKSGRPRVEQRGPAPDLSERDRQELADVLRGLTTNRELTTARRTSLAAAIRPTPACHSANAASGVA